MRLLRQDRLKEFETAHAGASQALTAWAVVVQRADWKSLVDVRCTYRHADGVVLPSGKTATIFNIKGNHYRLITAIDYKLGIVNILQFLTHAEDDKEQWKANL